MTKKTQNNLYLAWLVFIGFIFIDVLILKTHSDWYILILMLIWWLVVKNFNLKSKSSIMAALGCWLGVFAFSLLRLGLPAYKLSHWAFLFLSFGVVQMFFEKHD